MKNQWTLKILSVLFGLLGGLVLSETAFRIYHCWTYEDVNAIATNKLEPVLALDKELKFGEVIQLSSNKRIIYELIPSSSYQFQQVRVETNERGFRDKTYLPKKACNTKRIIGLGDSVMFGWGVEEEDCYLNQLERQLNQKDSLHYEVINTAVPGYNTAMELAVLQEKIDMSQVDLVIINFVKNDFDLPNFMKGKPNYLAVNNSFILEQFEDKRGFDHAAKPQFNVANWRFVQKPHKVPTEYQDMVGEASYQKAMEQLKVLSDQYAFKVIVLVHHPYLKLPPIVKEVTMKLNFELLIIKPYWTAYKEQYPDAKWELSPRDCHPTPAAHAVVAKALLEQIEMLW